MKIHEQKIKDLSLKIVRVLEVALCGLLICGIVLQAVRMVFAIPTLGTNTSTFEIFLDQALVYIIGLEIVLMLIHRDPYLVIDIVSFAIARKMVMTTENGLNFVLGSIAIFILYYVKCYGISCKLPWSKTDSTNTLFQSNEHHSL
ncbi:hypothetical protein [Alicyclobacillus macrosporangiidus]|uniref:hypothetical protein n=1 Tax=Alicyclobacillus macrosporangiidus TaxID=392015 RepID=UPI00049502B2|nr:hypothetical protein [Alicyclobacillus macrosporangiidus]MCL6599595.1 hypothetical protein [Alicyclobacillus macrosporangiidus]